MTSSNLVAWGRQSTGAKGQTSISGSLSPPGCLLLRILRVSCYLFPSGEFLMITQRAVRHAEAGPRLVIDEGRRRGGGTVGFGSFASIGRRTRVRLSPDFRHGCADCVAKVAKRAL